MNKENKEQEKETLMCVRWGRKEVNFEGSHWVWLSFLTHLCIIGERCRVGRRKHAMFKKMTLFQSYWFRLTCSNDQYHAIRWVDHKSGGDTRVLKIFMILRLETLKGPDLGQLVIVTSRPSPCAIRSTPTVTLCLRYYSPGIAAKWESRC